MEEGCNCGCAVSVYRRRGRVCIHVCSRARVRSVRRFFEKAVAFRTLIEIISMRIEPSQLTSVQRDYPCVSPNSTSPSAFTFPAFFFSFSNNREHLFGCNMKEQVLQIIEGPVVPHEADQQWAVKLTFCKDDSFQNEMFLGYSWVFFFFFGSFSETD